MWYRFKSSADTPAIARNAAEIHSFCAAVPEVRIHLPPAESPFLTRTRPLQVENRAFRAGVRRWVGGAVGGDAQDRAISRQRTPISLSGLIPVPRSAASAV